jgi:hypothetical protein
MESVTKAEIKQKIKELKQIKIDKFLTIDQKTDGFYNGQIYIYEKWLDTLADSE